MSRPSLWRHREFVKLWTGQAISQIGSRITRTALPFAAVITLGAGPIQMGILTGAAAASVLLFGLFAGAWADRVRRRPILIWRTWRARRCSCPCPIAAMRHSLTMTHLYVVAAAAGLFTVLFDVSYQAYVPSLVERENILQANAKLALSESVAEVSGPGIAGFLVTGADGAGRDRVRRALVSGLRAVAGAGPQTGAAAGAAVARGAHRARDRGRAAICLGQSVLARDGDLRCATAALFMGFFASMYPLFTVKAAELVAGGDRSGGASGGGAFAIVGRGARREDGAAVRIRPGVHRGRCCYEHHDVPASDGARLGDAVLRVPGGRPNGRFRLADAEHHGNEPAPGGGAAADFGPREFRHESAVQRH